MRPATDSRDFSALIGDVVQSRSLADRAQLQREIAREIEALNERLAAVLAAPLKLTAGDEIQGLFSMPEGVVDVLVGLADRILPAEIVWGLGDGPISTDLGPDVAMLDGPCFHGAGKAVAEASGARVWLRQDSMAGPHGESIPALFRLMGAIRSRWTESQLRYIRAVRMRPQRDVAALYEVDESTVSKALRAARFRDVEEGEAVARLLLNDLGAQLMEPPDMVAAVRRPRTRDSKTGLGG